MGFLFFQNEKCVAGFVILLLLEVMGRSLQCRWCINTERKGGPCSLIWIWGVVGQPHYLNRNLDFFLIQSLPLSREICYGPNCTQFNSLLIPSREWIQIKPSLLWKESIASAFLQAAMLWFPVQHPPLLCLGKALLPLDMFLVFPLS